MNEASYQIYHRWISHRNAQKVLIDGEFALFYDENIFGIVRFNQNEMSILLLNLSSVNQTVKLEQLTTLNLPDEQLQIFTKLVRDVVLLHILPSLLRNNLFNLWKRNVSACFRRLFL